MPASMGIIEKITNNLLVSALVFGLLTSIGSFGYQWYLRPRIILDQSGLFSKVGDTVVGNVQVINLGRTVEEGMTVRINSAVDNADDVSVLVNQVPTEEKIILRPDFTDVIIQVLYPEDDAFISFKPKDTSATGFSASHFGRNMRTSRYEDLDWTAEWWQINQMQLAALSCLLISAIFLGIFLSKRHLSKKS